VRYRRPSGCSGFCADRADWSSEGDLLFAKDGNTTYYQAAGARALFTANAQGLYDRTIIPAPPFLTRFSTFAYVWSGLEAYFMTAYRTCQGWTSSADTEQGDCAEVASEELFTANQPESCAHRSQGLICVSQ
jgi:hypothetical protein